MKYFESFPKLIYTFGQDNFNQQLVTNIFARSSFLREVANNVDIAYEYQVQDSDTPEIIAHKVYGDPYRSWIVLLYNKIINPYYDWPMKNDVLETYVANKYGTSLELTKSTIHHYEKVVDQVASYNGVVLQKNTASFIISTYDYNQNTESLVLNTLPTTADTSVTISTETLNYNTYTLTVTTTHKAVSNYTYEFNENEKRRTIKLLEDIYVTRVEQEFKEIMRDG
jgi:hypothetical protein